VDGSELKLLQDELDQLTNKADAEARSEVAMAREQVLVSSAI